MKYFKNGLLFGLIGIPCGVFINYTVYLIVLAGYKNGLTFLFGDFLFQYIISIIIGFAFGFSAVIFRIDNWSITRQTVVHFILTFCTYLPCSLAAGWIPAKPAAIALFVSIYVLIYAGIWFGQYHYWKNKIKRLNNTLSQKQG